MNKFLFHSCVDQICSIYLAVAWTLWTFHINLANKMFNFDLTNFMQFSFIQF